jgi:hypothetical protein
MACRAGQTWGPCRGRLHVRGVRIRVRRIDREQARVTGRIIATTRSMARTAGEYASRLVMACRACGGTGRAERDSRRPAGRAIVATTACVEVVRIQHGRPASAAQQASVPRVGSRIHDTRRVHRAAKRWRARRHPSRDDCPLMRREQPLVWVVVESRDDRSARIRGESRRGSRRRHAPDGRKKRRYAPPGGRRVFAVTRRAVAPQDESNVDVVRRGLRLARAVLRARGHEQGAAHGDRRHPRPHAGASGRRTTAVGSQRRSAFHPSRRSNHR